MAETAEQLVQILSNIRTAADAWRQRYRRLRVILRIVPDGVQIHAVVEWARRGDELKSGEHIITWEQLCRPGDIDAVRLVDSVCQQIPIAALKPSDLIGRVDCSRGEIYEVNACAELRRVELSYTAPGDSFVDRIGLRPERADEIGDLLKVGAQVARGEMA
jgi:hypothetical protein